MPSPDAVKAQLAEARKAADTARAEAKKISKQCLDALLAMSIEQRFKAIEQPNPDLLPEHRLELVRSLRVKDAAPKSISSKTAGWWAIFQSRLPYRWGRYGSRGVFAVAVVLAIVMAYSHTPIRSMTFNQNVVTVATMPDGSRTRVTILTSTPFDVMRETDTQYTIRWWIPRQGYAEATAPIFLPVPG